MLEIARKLYFYVLFYKSSKRLSRINDSAAQVAFSVRLQATYGLTEWLRKEDMVKAILNKDKPI